MFTGKPVQPEGSQLSRPTTTFAIVGNPRTGSSHLASLLDSHPDIACWDDEIFDAGETFDRSGLDTPRQFLMQEVWRAQAPVVGFKMLWDALNRREAMWAMLRDQQVALVHVTRDHLLDAFLSFRLATQNLAFTSWDGNYRLPTVEVDVAECVEWMNLAEHRDGVIRQRADEVELPLLTIGYAELCSSADRVLDFLQVSHRPLRSRLSRQRHGTHYDVISNLAELRAELAGTRWAAMLEDPDPDPDPDRGSLCPPPPPPGVVANCT
jgi:hypothetical protein